jgi:hypothetical protein
MNIAVIFREYGNVLTIKAFQNYNRACNLCNYINNRWYEGSRYYSVEIMYLILEKNETGNIKAS